MTELKPCKFAVDDTGEFWECTCYRKTFCHEQKCDYNSDGSINVVFCGLGEMDTKKGGAE